MQARIDIIAKMRRQRADGHNRVIARLCEPVRGLSSAKLRELNMRNMGLFEADNSPFAFDSSTGPMSAYFNALPLIVDSGVPKNTLERDVLAWERWEEFCAGVGTPPWRLDRNAHSGADPVGFARESRLLCAFLVWCYDIIQPRSKTSATAKPASSWKMIDGVRSVHRRA